MTVIINHQFFNGELYYTIVERSTQNIPNPSTLIKSSEFQGDKSIITEYWRSFKKNSLGTVKTSQNDVTTEDKSVSKPEKHITTDLNDSSDRVNLLKEAPEIINNNEPKDVSEKSPKPNNSSHESSFRIDGLVEKISPIKDKTPIIQNLPHNILTKSKMETQDTLHPRQQTLPYSQMPQRHISSQIIQQQFSTQMPTQMQQQHAVNYPFNTPIVQQKLLGQQYQLPTQMAQQYYLSSRLAQNQIYLQQKNALQYTQKPSLVQEKKQKEVHESKLVKSEYDKWLMYIQKESIFVDAIQEEFFSCLKNFTSVPIVGKVERKHLPDETPVLVCTTSHSSEIAVFKDSLMQECNPDFLRIFTGSVPFNHK